MTRKLPPFHPLLVPLLPPLILYSRNFDSVVPGDAVAPALTCLAATLLGWSALKGARFDGRAAALIASAAVVLGFGFAPLARWVGRAGPGLGASQRGWLALVLEGSALVGLAVLLKARPGLARWLTRPADAAALGLVGVSAFGLASRSVGDPSARPPIARIAPLPALSRPERPPDVYFIVLDAYGRSDILKELYGFDNGPFLERLERKGFRVARRSTSNYVQTALSIAATLNFRYLDDLEGSPSSKRAPLRTLIAEGAAVRAFRSQGYRIVSFASGFGATELPGVADEYLAPPIHLGDFSMLLANQTPLGLLGGRFRPHAMHRERILSAFDRLPGVAEGEVPTFCFVHIVGPHPPFVFGEHGEDVSAREGAYSLSDGEGWRAVEGHGGVDGYVARYRAQVAFLTGRVEEAVDRLLARSTRRPIIVIQGDHGPGGHFESMKAEPNDLRERTGILNAWLLPDAEGPMPDDAISPVNTFRVILDRTFQAGLGCLPDRTFYSSYKAPYRFIDVTDQVRPDH